MKLAQGIVSATPSLLKQAITSAAGVATSPLDVIVHANGFEPDMGDLMKIPNIGNLIVTHSSENVGVTEGLHRIWESACMANVPIIAYQHDDVDIFENGWDARVIRNFVERPKCGLATFGGARGLGLPDLYVFPYEMGQLARRDFMSNMRSAEGHGLRTTEERRIATPDGFSMIVRRSLLDELGGWRWYPYPHHNYDNSIACQARRHDLEAWLIPVDCEHYGGATATKGMYQEWAQQRHGGDVAVHRDSHVWLYKTFEDVLPFYV